MAINRHFPFVHILLKQSLFASLWLFVFLFSDQFHDNARTDALPVTAFATRSVLWVENDKTTILRTFAERDRLVVGSAGLAYIRFPAEVLPGSRGMAVCGPGYRDSEPQPPTA